MESENLNASNEHPKTMENSKTKNTTPKRGVVYLGKVPPHTTPSQIKQLLERYAPVERIYLTPKAASANRKANFGEGWAEFCHKKDARRVADLLNGQPIGNGCGKRAKKKYYSEDLWCIKYLSGFKWTQLTEQKAYERAIKEQKLKTEIAQGKRENALYVKQVERAKMVENICKKRGTQEEGGRASLHTDSFESLKARFKQRKIVDEPASM